MKKGITEIKSNTAAHSSITKVGMFKTSNDDFPYLIEELVVLILDYSDLHELIALSMTSKTSQSLILDLAK